MNPPLVSIIIPAYRHENYIHDAIRSVMNQTYKNIELIIIDDNSPDNTWNKIQEILPECEKRFVRVVAKTKPNGGICDSLNIGLELAAGEYVGILASDDMYKPELVETLAGFLSQNPEYGLAVGNNEIIDTNGKTCFWDKNRNSVYDEESAVYKTFVDFLKKDRPDVDSGNFGTYITFCRGNYVPNGSLIRRDLFQHFLPFPLDIKLEDWYMHLQLSKYCKYKYIDRVLFRYRWHDSNTIKNTDFLKGNMKVVVLHEARMVTRRPEFIEIFDQRSGLHKTIFKFTKFFYLYKTPHTLIFRIGNKQFVLRKTTYKSFYE